MSAILRQIKPIKIPNLEIFPIVGNLPQFTTASPTDLYVEPEYQRNLSDNSIRLIRKIVGQWNWAHTKPPICVQDGEKLMVIDGQHTAIAAASRGDIKKLPIVIISKCEMKERALAFVAHNTLRVQVTTVQIHLSRLAAGDETAVAIQEACKRAGAKILPCPPAHGIFNVGETLAVKQLETIANKKGVVGTARILKILVKAKRQVKGTEMAALFLILYSKKFDPVDDEDLISVIGSKPIRAWENSVIGLREKKKISLSMALAIKWTRAANGMAE